MNLRHGAKLKLWIIFEPRKPYLYHYVFSFSEFDLVAVVLLVGDAYLSGQQKRQWIFMTDGSGSKLDSTIETGEVDNCIIAVSFLSPVIEDDCSFKLFSKTLEGSTVFYSRSFKTTTISKPLIRNKLGVG
jgi:hypothetical protein